MPSTQAAVRLADPSKVMDALQAHLAEHDIMVVERPDHRLASLPSGEARFQLTANELLLEAHAPNQAELEAVTSFLASHVLEFADPERPAIRWAGFAPRGSFADFREMRVIRVADLTPHMRRITLTGEDLERFATDEHLHIRLYFPQDPAHPQWPTRGIDGLGVVEDPSRAPHMRKYTIRRIDLETSEVDVDFVLHADPGPGSDWAKSAKAGALVGMAGPGGRSVSPGDWYLLAGDETALPAIARILETLPRSAEGEVLIEVEQAGDIIPLVKPAGFNIRWLSRAESGPSIVEEVRKLALPSHRKVFCWAGIEFSAAQEIRAHWRETCKRGKSQQLSVSYWRRGVADAA